jgi:uncharacterized protein (UPF0147 family)
VDKEQEYDENGRSVKKKNKDVKNKDTIIAIDPQQKLKGDKLGEDVRAMARSGRPSGTKATLVFAFGRMNPPTLGHEKLVNKVDDIGRRNKAQAKVFLTHSQDNKKNPLTQNQKLRFAKGAFGPKIEAAPGKTLIDVLKVLQKSYSDVIMVAGSDRVKDFTTLLNKYNMKEYHFDSIKVVSAGERDPDAEGATGMSASKMRQAAIDNKFSDFKKGLPSRLRNGEQLFKAVRKGLGIKEEVEEVSEEQVDEILTIAGRRKKAIAMRRQRLKIKRARERMKYRFAGAAQLKRRTRKKAVSAIKKRVAGSRGANYTKLSPGQKASVDRLVAKRKTIINKIAQRLAPKVRRAEAQRLKNVRRKANEAFEAILNEYDNSAVDAMAQSKAAENIINAPQDPDIADRKGTQPAKYHKGLSKSTKAKRDAHFKAKKDGPAPGDANAKTKPSKYTKMYHDTYGEGVEMEYSDFFKLIDKIEEDVSPVLKARQEREKKQLAVKHTRQQSRAKIRSIRSEDIDQAFGELISEKSQSALAKKSESSGVSVGTLRKVYNRGVAAWKTGHRPGTTPEQWGYARVNAFIAKKKKGNLNHDKDLA